MSASGAPYDDGRIRCGEDEIVIRWYYLWGAKHVPYDRIRSVTVRPLGRLRGRWRIWGSGDLRHWYNLDRTRPGKTTALELDLGGRVRPTITPDDAGAVVRILEERLGHERITGERTDGDGPPPSGPRQPST